MIRHAQAQIQANDERDFQRVLSAHGAKEALLLGDYLKATAIPFEAIFSSPAKRTIETSEKILNTLESKVKIIEAEEYYEATSNTMVASIMRLESMFKNIIVVGHNPSISHLFEYLVGDEIGNFSTASCAWVQFELDDWTMVSRSSGILKEHYYPGKMILK